MADALNTFLAMEAAGSPVEVRQGLHTPSVQPEQPAGVQAEGYPRDLMQLHSRLVRWFEEAETASAEARRLAERDRDYYDGHQWTADELEALRKRGQPPLSINYVRRKVDLLSGLERKARTDPKAYPRTPDEENRADAATQALRYIGDSVNLPILRSAVYDNLLIDGYGGVEIGLEDDGKGGADITMTQVPWDRLFHDPHSRDPAFADARYLGMVLWMDRDQLLDLYPDAEGVIGDTFSPSYGTYQDRLGAVSWQDTRRERCRVVQCYWSEGGQWWGATISRAGFFAEPQESPFVDRKGRSTCQLVLQGAYINRENRRYGAVRDLISLQDEINKRRSKALHLLSVNRVIAEQGAVEDVDRARREVAKPDGYVEIMPNMRFDVAPAGELAAGQFQLLQHATQEMQASGPNASMAGNDPRDLSGRAILAQQAGGAAQNEPLADALRQWTRRVYEIAWMAARKYWTGERWIRVTDDLGKMQFIGLNRQVTLRDELASMPEDQRAAAMQQLQLVPGDPRLMQVIRTENDISDLEVDITIEEGPDVPAQAAEQFQSLSQMVPALPPQIQLSAWKLLIASSALKDKDKLLDQFEEAEKGAGMGQQQQQAMAQEVAQAELRETNSKASLNEARVTDLLHGSAAKIAQTEKMVAESPALPVGGPGLQPQMPQGGPQA